MITVATPAGEAQPTQDLSFTYYVQNDYAGDSARKRWDGTAWPPDYLQWRTNPSADEPPGPLPISRRCCGNGRVVGAGWTALQLGSAAAGG